MRNTASEITQTDRCLELPSRRAIRWPILRPAIPDQLAIIEDAAGKGRGLPCLSQNLAQLENASVERAIGNEPPGQIDPGVDKDFVAEVTHEAPFAAVKLRFR